jgi:hypothetical protein
MRSVPASVYGRIARRAWNCGSCVMVFTVFTGQIGVFTFWPNSTHSAVVRVAKISASSRRSATLPRAWSAYFAPGLFANSSGLPMPSQKFFQNSRSEAMNSTSPSFER